MLAVDGQQLGAVGAHRIHEQAPRHDQRLLVSQQHPLAGTRCRQRRQQAGGADDTGHHEIHLGGARNQLEPGDAIEHLRFPTSAREALAQAPSAFGVRHDGESRSPFEALLGEAFVVAVGRQREHLEAPGISSDHVQRVDADSTGCSEYGEPFHDTLPCRKQPSTNTGAAAVRLSMRSSIPPWPGTMLPLSFNPA